MIALGTRKTANKERNLQFWCAHWQDGLPWSNSNNKNNSSRPKSNLHAQATKISNIPLVANCSACKRVRKGRRQNSLKPLVTSVVKLWCTNTFEAWILKERAWGVESGSVDSSFRDLQGSWSSGISSESVVLSDVSCICKDCLWSRQCVWNLKQPFYHCQGQSPILRTRTRLPALARAGSAPRAPAVGRRARFSAIRVRSGDWTRCVAWGRSESGRASPRLPWRGGSEAQRRGTAWEGGWAWRDPERRRSPPPILSSCL